ncbi:hypothetical protein GUJ93_ZPchr0014g46993 [Zizania palustris]|uniref:Uncharacterized protein n=1 Tax=Zizania palustris TaxID=103762 RepID=A0A8J5T851_ZIZPA|nr:hypothetical protein GUJ93_ZPchr0014g46993 [Zizania palustris]
MSIISKNLESLLKSQKTHTQVDRINVRRSTPPFHHSRSSDHRAQPLLPELPPTGAGGADAFALIDTRLSFLSSTPERIRRLLTCPSRTAGATRRRRESSSSLPSSSVAASPGDRPLGKVFDCVCDN